MSRCRVLFVANSFVQAGSERCLYEVCRALDKNRFQVEVLTMRAFRPAPVQYYYFRLREMGIPVHRKITRPVYFSRLLGGFGRSPRWRRLVNRIHGTWLRFRLRGFRQYDLVAFVLIEPFKSLQHALRPDDRFVVHLMAHRFQYPYDPYADCRVDLPYRMIVMDPGDQRADLDGTPCARAKTFYFPMAMPVSGPAVSRLTTKNAAAYRIGVVSRVGPDRPLRPFFDALQRLRQSADATLRIYGRGDPRQFASDIEQRGIGGAVLFEGHAEDVEQRLQDDRIDLVWMISIGPAIGYGSVETAAQGVPVLFYNLSRLTSDEDVGRQTGGAMHVFSDAAKLADFSLDLLRAPDRLAASADRLCEYVRREHDIGPHMARLQEYYLQIAGRSDLFADATPTTAGPPVGQAVLDTSNAFANLAD
jgi:glycosyltransferase involved in cell wall biosynthesis